MKGTMTAHLTDEQFADYAIGEKPSLDAQAHVALCEQCRNEVGAFQFGVKGFKEVSQEWSGSQPTFSPRSSRLVSSRNVPIALRWGMAGLAVLAVAIPITRNLDHRAGDRSASLDAPEDSAAQIAQDDRLMENVNLALTSSDESPFNEYGLTQGPGTRRKMPSRLRNQ